MRFSTYEPARHFADVAALWTRALGQAWPVTHRVLGQRIGWRENFEPGDGVVAEQAAEVVGFGIIDVNRTPFARAGAAAVQTLVVAPEHRNRGLGTEILARLEARALAAGCTSLRVGSGLYRFWSGIPDDLPEAQALFNSRGFQLKATTDLLIPLIDYRPKPRYEKAILEAGASVQSLEQSDLGALLDFATRDFPDWRHQLLNMLVAGEIANVLVMKRRGSMIGFSLTATPQSRFRGANLVWEAVHGPAMGGFGAVGIAKDWRGHGLGAALGQASAVHVQRCGATCAYIDMTTLVEFYAKIGARVCGRFRRGAKTL